MPSHSEIRELLSHALDVMSVTNAHTCRPETVEHLPPDFLADFDQLVDTTLEVIVAFIEFLPNGGSSGDGDSNLVSLASRRAA